MQAQTGAGSGGSDAGGRGDDARPQSGRRLLVVSHPAIVDVNQLVYRELSRRGWDVTIVLPSRWRSEYSGASIHPKALAEMDRALRPTRVVLAGRPQRHLYLTRCRSLCARLRPDVAFIEAEPYSLASFQWGFPLTRLGVPFGLQCYENIDRPLPAPVRAARTLLLRRVAFVAARSKTAGDLARQWGARGPVGFAPPAVPGWERPVSSDKRPFTVGYAGRLIESKGLFDLLAAVRRMREPVELLLIGDGELRSRLADQPIPGSRVRVLTGVRHDRMVDAYAEIDVLVLPSHTTPAWKEQFGRVIVEALWCGVPVVGSDSGEIPWLIELTGGGLVFAEGDAAALTERLESLRASTRLRERLAGIGREAVERLFTVPAATDALERLLSAACPTPVTSSSSVACTTSAKG